MNPTLNAIVIGLVIAAFTVVCAVVRDWIKKQDSKTDDLVKAVATLTNQLGRLDVQVSPLWAKVQAQISADLHHPHPRYAEMDTLLEQLDALTITVEERIRLKELLLERSTDTHPDITDDQRKKATLMITVMEMVLVEKSVNQAAASMETVVAKMPGKEDVKESARE